jgi:hypothetical protein
VNKHHIVPFALLLLGCVVGACSSWEGLDQDESPGSVQSALSLPGLVAQPNNWFGTPIDLMVADAVASCSWQSATATLDNNTTVDGYIATVAASVLTSQCGSGGVYSTPAGQSLWGHWWYQRDDANCNKSANPSDGSSLNHVTLPRYLIPNAVVQGTTAGVPVSSHLPADANYDGSTAAATAMIRAPLLNLCIAQQLRAQAPGTAGAAALLLSTNDQRLLLEVTRERAQIAMLGFAQLGVVFAQPSQTITTAAYAGVSTYMPFPMVTAWGQDPANGARVLSMGADFATAVQLHTIVSQEFAELLARSSSSRESRGGHAYTTAEEVWGVGSWRQRTLVSLYGGAPLAAEEDGSTPWVASPLVTTPDQPIPGHYPLWWPSPSEQPFPTTDMNHPEASRLLALARASDVVDVKTYSSMLLNSCSNLNPDATAKQIYLATEIALENSTCALKSSTGCTIVTASNLPVTCQPFSTVNPDYSGCLLWATHGIAPEHALLTAGYVKDLLQPVCRVPGSGPSGGARSLTSGSLGPSSVISMDPGTEWYHLSSDATFVERTPAQVQSLYGRYAHFYMASNINMWNSPVSQGYPTYAANGVAMAPSLSEEGKRYLGSSAALVATQQAVLDAYAPSTAPANVAIQKYLAYASRILALTTGAVGNTTVIIRPTLSASPTKGQPSTVSSWNVVVTTPTGNQSWPTNAIKALRMPSLEPNVAALVANPTTTMFGQTAATILAANASLGNLTALSPKSGYDRFSLSFPLSLNPRPLTLIATAPAANASGVDALGAPSIVLAAGVYIADASDAKMGYYLSQGGSLGVYAERLFYGLPSNPSKPAFDGFGFPTDWVPPTDPSLFAGVPGEDAAAHYLSRAGSAASEATAAVQQAFETILQNASDTATVAATQSKSAMLVQQSKDELCGKGNPNCDTTVSPTNVVFAGSPSCTTPSLTTEQTVNCIAASMLKEASTKFPIANAVIPFIDSPAVPSFDAYNGGRLQGMFIAQWGAIKQLKDVANDLIKALAATQAHVAAADAEFALLNEEAKSNCSIGRMFAAAAAGTSVSAGFASVSASFSPGPMIAQQQKCDDITASLPAGAATKTAAMMDALVAMGSHAARVHDIMTTIAEVSSSIKLEVANASRNQAQAALEEFLTSAGQTTSFGIYRSYHDYDLWRAKALLEDARRFSVAARRAIEAKYLIDLSGMNAPEAFVAAPSSWADEIYDADLSLPTAVGLSVGTPDASGIYPNKVLDYVGNLQRFVDGYAVNRPSATASGDSDVITLLGPDTVVTDPAAGTLTGKDQSMRYAWSYFCPSGSSGQWTGLPQLPVDPAHPEGATVPGKADKACAGQKPTKARLIFSLDAWGRVNTYQAQSMPSKRFNARWNRIAVNLVGTGIKDCTKAADALGCYSSSFVPYNLSHVGPSWVVDFAGSWRTLNVPVGQINQAKALSAEQWLNPVTNGWSQPYVQAIERHEFAERPLDGTYQLELDVAPEVQLGSIDRVQVLADTSYWVRQN